MDSDPGETGDQPMAQEPEAPPACSRGGQEEKTQEEKMQEEENTAMKTKRPMEDEETEAKRPRVEDEPRNSIHTDIDIDEELNKLKMQNWNFMSMVKGYDFPTSKRSTTVHARTWRTTARCSFWEGRVDRRRTW